MSATSSPFPDAADGWVLTVSTSTTRIYRRDDFYGQTSRAIYEDHPALRAVRDVQRNYDRSNVPRLVEEFRRIRASGHLNRLPTWARGWAFGDEVPLRLPRRQEHVRRLVIAMHDLLGRRVPRAPRGRRPLRSRPGMARRILTANLKRGTV